MNDLTPFGYNIEVDGAGMLSLTDLWKEAGCPQNQEPAKWKRTDEASKFIKTVCKILNVLEKHIIKSSRGKGGGTFAHPQIAAEYAQYLDPKLAVYVNQLFLNPESATKHAVLVWEKKGRSKTWIQERMTGVVTRKAFTDTLQIHGVDKNGFKICTNAIYTPLWGGKGAETIRKKKGLPEKSNTREAMSEVELAAVRLSELLATETIEKNNAIGNLQCKNHCTSAASNVAKAIISQRKNNNQNFLPK